jgi:vacuolar-type H+-ATPase subunit E/Vma4
MGRRELLDALKREGLENMAVIAARGNADEERLRAGFYERLAELRREYEGQCELQCSELQRAIISRAERDAALSRLRAEHKLSVRLHEQACSGVMQMGADDPEALFRALLAELPPESWRSVRVNPETASLAAARFPTAEIGIDPLLSAGFIVTAEDGSLTIDNTLSTRLERLWPELLPALLAEIRRCAL